MKTPRRSPRGDVEEKCIDCEGGISHTDGVTMMDRNGEWLSKAVAICASCSGRRWDHIHQMMGGGQ
ncbi:hypothetical protein LCGC14_2267820 [marine sediment metagenome]|uniref:Uncharacterized protein n=1 Tax=marine sediment metagenome TaxID=412755 RepID=A0A0F9CXX0_9ZZZZ